MKRREFIQRACCMAATGLLSSRAVWWPVSARALEGSAAATNRVLVLLVQAGGNDGLNTLVPFTDPLYYQLRPTLGVPANQVLPLNGVAGLHPNLAPLMPFWNAGQLAVVRDVGYPAMSLSHFRAQDIVFSGSSSNQNLPTGWLARWLEQTHPAFPDVFPDNPMAIQQGIGAGLLLQGDRGVTGLNIYDPDSFFWLVNTTYPGTVTDTPPAGQGGSNLGFLRTVDRAGFEYSNVIQAAATQGQNRVTYPDTGLGAQLATIARLIDGHLNTPIFVTGHDGFDTHTNQPGAHPELMSDYAGAVAAFMNDLGLMGRRQDVLLLTVSEFGRRVEENGDAGTDHGTAAPWLLLGGGLNGGVYGGPNHLDQLDDDGNLAPLHDYRSVYTTILESWFNTDPAVTQTILKGSFPFIPFLQAPSGVEEPAGGGRGGGARLLAPTPNPAHGPRTIRFQLERPGAVELAVYDISGRRVALLKEGVLPAGGHELSWNATGVAAGLYILELRAGGEPLRQKLIVE